jgi:hypothetical protein
MITIRWTRVFTVVAALSAAMLALPGRASAQSAGWDLALTGGFVANGLTDPVWALATATGSPIRVVQRQTQQESDVALGAAMFVQVHHARYDWVAPLSFGLGLRDSGRAVLYFGSALRFGAHASFTAGAAVGPVAALPAGVIEGRALADSNALSNLVTRTTTSWFAGVTYTFATLR